MTVAVTGATGFIGGHVARAFASRGVPVVALHRHAPPPAPRAGIEWTTFDDFERRGGSFEALVHVAAVRHRHGVPLEQYGRQNVALTARLLAAAKGRVGRFVDVSSIAVFGWPPDLPIDENQPFAPVGPYGRSKVETERMVRTSGLPYAIVRPSITYGPGDTNGMIDKLFRLVKAGRYRLVGSGSSRVQLVYAEDLAHAIVETAIRDPASTPRSSSARTATRSPFARFRALVAQRSSAGLSRRSESRSGSRERPPIRLRGSREARAPLFGRRASGHAREAPDDDRRPGLCYRPNARPSRLGAAHVVRGGTAPHGRRARAGDLRDGPRQDRAAGRLRRDATSGSGLRTNVGRSTSFSDDGSRKIRRRPPSRDRWMAWPGSRVSTCCRPRPAAPASRWSSLTRRARRSCGACTAPSVSRSSSTHAGTSWPDETFDLVLSYNALPVVPDWRALPRGGGGACPPPALRVRDAPGVVRRLSPEGPSPRPAGRRRPRAFRPLVQRAAHPRGRDQRASAASRETPTSTARGGPDLFVETGETLLTGTLGRLPFGARFRRGPAAAAPRLRAGAVPLRARTVSVLRRRRLGRRAPARAPAASEP